MTREKRPIGGILLCGGESRRMGRPKAWLPFGGETLLERIVAVLRQVVEPVVVVAAAGQELPALPEEVGVVRDSQPGRGPMQGLADGLRALQGRVEAAYVSSCDTPLLQLAFVSRITELFLASRERQRPEYAAPLKVSPVADAPGSPEICVPLVDGRYHPLAGVYRLSILPVVERFLQEGRRRLTSLIEEVPVQVVNRDELIDVDPELRSLRNVNTWEDYEAALAINGNGAK